MLQEGGHIRCLKPQLLENHVVDRTGWRAYALFMAAAVSRMEVCPEAIYESSEGLGNHDPKRRCLSCPPWPRILLQEVA